jgi:hypothetical protein
MTTLSVEKPAYLLGHDWEQEPYRLALLEHHADPTTARRLQATGLSSGWWRSGTASILDDDDPRARLKGLPWLNSALVRLVGTELVTVRVALE